MRKIILTLSCLFIFLCAFAQQRPQVQFGKNRVQYHQDYDEWLMYESRNFITYWYGEGRFIGQSAVQLAEYDFEEIQAILEHRLNNKIEIIVYTDLTDLKQGNIGSEEAFENSGGQTKIVGNKMFIHFDGNHNHLRQEIREGIASVYLNAMLFGSNLQEIVQNAVLLSLPGWFKNGLVAYIGEEWNTELDNQLRDILARKEHEDFNDLVQDYPKLVGQSVWYYINQNYGKATVSNLLYLTRINRSIESGFLYVLGNSYEQTLENWQKFYERRYSEEVKVMQSPDAKQLVEIKNKHNLPMTQVKLSPSGQYAAYVQNEVGKYKVFIQDLISGERTLVKKSGFRNLFQATDYNYPLLAWSPSGFELAIMWERRDVLQLSKYDVNTKETVTEEMDPQYQRVYSMDYVNVQDMVLSATVRGASDIFYYRSNVRATSRITNDFYDDLNAVFVKIRNKKGILFASNRDTTSLASAKLDTILPIKSFDIYYYDLDTKSKELVRVTNTPFADEREPLGIDSTHFAFLSDETGIYNRKYGFLEDYVAYMEQVIEIRNSEPLILPVDSVWANTDSLIIDTTFIRPVIKTRAINHTASNLNRNIITQHKSVRNNKMIDLIYKEGAYSAYIGTANPATVVTPALTNYKSQQVVLLSKRNKAKAETPIKIASNKDQQPATNKQTPANKEESGGYLFESGFDDPPVETPATADENAKKTPKTDEKEYLFQTEFEEPSEIVTTSEGAIDKPQRASRGTADSPDIVIAAEEVAVAGLATADANKKAVTKFRPARITPYRLKFKTDFVTTSLDNSLLYGGLESPAANPDGFETPVPGILMKTNFKDLFEDYVFELGARFPTSFDGDEYFLTFKNKKKRLDKTFTAYRKTKRYSLNNNSFAPERTREIVLLGQAQFSYPLDIFTSIRGIVNLRNDKLVQLATDSIALNTFTTNQQRASVRLEYVFDNTLDVSLNIKNGTRYKIFGEVVKRFDLSVLDGFNFEVPKGAMGIVGVDARHYQRILKHSVWATRFNAATSFGSEKILYYLGGVENWLFPSFNNDIPGPTGDNFSYQTLASNLRGFKQNIRNGNSYALINSELRVPIFRYFSRSTPRSSFIKNFQLVGFFDVGTAWQGLSPFKKDNPLNTVTIEGSENASDFSPVSLEVNFFRDPVVAGYGAGIRTMLFGYFLKLDYAWGIETRVVQKPRLYFSMGTDF
ncbi:MAG: hypothetical protein AB8G86_29075 [Saprospiraceae bacterium]